MCLRVRVAPVEKAVGVPERLVPPDFTPRRVAARDVRVDVVFEHALGPHAAVHVQSAVVREPRGVPEVRLRAAAVLAEWSFVRDAVGSEAAPSRRVRVRFRLERSGVGRRAEVPLVALPGLAVFARAEDGLVVLAVELLERDDVHAAEHGLGFVAAVVRAPVMESQSGNEQPAVPWP